MNMGQHSKTLARDLFCAVTRPLANRCPIEKYPGWLGTLHNLRVPNNVRPKLQPRPGGGANVRILFHTLDSVLSLAGDVAECGVFQGSTLIPIGLLLRHRGSSKKVLGFDSFEGLDDTVTLDIGLGGDHDHRKQVGGFSNTSYENLVRKIQQFKLTNAVSLVKGYFQNSLAKYADRRFCFVHLDCVIYESYKECLEFFYPRMVTGGVILLDEYTDPPWPGCKRAVDEFLADKPEKLVEIVRDNQIKHYLRKL